MRKHPILTALLVLAVARFFIATVTPVFDTSEARYAAISANMARTGDFLVPRFTYDDVYQSFDGKPPLLFQTAGAACKVLGCREIAVRLPSLLATLALLGLLWYTVKTLSDRRRALLAVGICSTSVAVYALSGFCMTDALLIPCIAGAYLSYALLLRTGQRNWSLGIFLSLAFGMLVKGPVAVALFVGPLVIDACVNHHWRRILSFRWFSGTLIFLGIAAPWFILMERQTPGFLRYFFINENLLRFLVKDYGDKYGAGREFFRGMALVWALVVTLPWTPALLFGDRTKRDVFFWGIVGITGFWCLTSRIPLTYVMPIVLRPRPSRRGRNRLPLAPSRRTDRPQRLPPLHGIGDENAHPPRPATPRLRHAVRREDLPARPRPADFRAAVPHALALRCRTAETHPVPASAVFRRRGPALVLARCRGIEARPPRFLPADLRPRPHRLF